MPQRSFVMARGGGDNAGEEDELGGLVHCRGHGLNEIRQTHFGFGSNI